MNKMKYKMLCRDFCSNVQINQSIGLFANVNNFPILHVKERGKLAFRRECLNIDFKVACDINYWSVWFLFFSFFSMLHWKILVHRNITIVTPQNLNSIAWLKPNQMLLGKQKESTLKKWKWGLFWTVIKTVMISLLVRLLLHLDAVLFACLFSLILFWHEFAQSLMFKTLTIRTKGFWTNLKIKQEQ